MVEQEVQTVAGTECRYEERLGENMRKLAELRSSDGQLRETFIKRKEGQDLRLEPWPQEKLLQRLRS